MAKKASTPAAAAATGPKADITKGIKQDVLPRLKQWVPALAETPDDGLYDTAMAEPALLHACLQTFLERRADFADITTGVGGAPIVDNDKPLRCERTVDEIIGMAVRSGARAFSRRVLDDKTPVRRTVEEQRLVDRLTRMVKDLWGADTGKTARSPKSPAQQFYEAIRDNLDYAWQVPLFPYYVELPPTLIAELGKGLTCLRTPDGIRELAEIGRDSLDEAKRIVGDELAREMLDVNPKSARGVASVGKAEFDRLNACFGDRLGEERWEVFNDVDRLEALKGMDAKAIELLGPYLPIVGGETLKNIHRRFKQTYQIGAFLDVGLDILGKDLFVGTFGSPGRPGAVRKITDKMSQAKLDAANPAADFSARLADVLRAYAASPETYARQS
jgi:hypothetical protein